MFCPLQFFLKQGPFMGELFYVFGPKSKKFGTLLVLYLQLHMHTFTKSLVKLGFHFDFTFLPLTYIRLKFDIFSH